MIDREKLLEMADDIKSTIHEKQEQTVFDYKVYSICCQVQAMLKEQEIPTELKQKMWNALYAEEEEYEKKFVGKEEHLNWFTVYRPWLQKGFDIAINVIADWEGR